MAATKNTLKAIWGKSSQPKAREVSSDQLSVHSTRSRAAEERSAPEKEATSRLAKPDSERIGPAKDPGLVKEFTVRGPSQEAPQDAAECTSSDSTWQKKKRKREPEDGDAVIDLSLEPADDLQQQDKADNKPQPHENADCMEIDQPEQGLVVATAAQQQDGLKADTPEEKAHLLAKVQAEISSTVAQHLLGCSQPLQAVTQHVYGIYSMNTEDDSLSEASVQTMIVDLATRKSFAARDAASKSADVLEDSSKHLLWQWELRDVKAIPKALKPAARAHKKLMHQVADRLTALTVASKALDTSLAGKGSAAKLQKAIAKLEKAENPFDPQPKPAAAGTAHAPAAAAPQMPETGQVSAPAPAEASLPSQVEAVLSTPAAPTEAELKASNEAEAKGKLKEEEVAKEKEEQKAKKERQKAEKEAEKEQARLKKEQDKQEKEREKQEKAAAKEREKQEKAAEREKARLQKEAEKQMEKAEKGAKVTGFKSGKAQAKAAAFMSSFFKTPAKAQQERIASQPAESPQTAQKPHQPYLEVFTPAPERARLPVPRNDTARIDEALKAAKSASEDELQHQHDNIMASFRRSKEMRVPGLPPSWARRRSVEEHLDEFGDLSGATLWRRKLLRPDPAAPRPAYFGSWRKISAVVRGRDPLGKDPDLDYEVMSDEEWEDEPEGENLSDDDMEEEEDEYEESEDGFVVPNGYISEDEGLGSVQQSLNELCADLEDDTSAEQMAAHGADQSFGAQQERMKMLGKALEKANRAGKPIIISRLPGSASSQDSCGTACLVGDPALLLALQPKVLAKNIKITMIPPPATEAEQAGAAPAPKVRERPDQEELVPALEDFLKAHPEMKSITKMAKAFQDAHPERRVIKTWVTAKIKEIADHGIAGWVIKREHSAIKSSQDPIQTDEDNATAGPVSQAPSQAAPAAPKPFTDGSGVKSKGDKNPFARKGSNLRALFGRMPASSLPRKTSQPIASAPEEVVVTNDDPIEDAPQAERAAKPEAKLASSTADPCWQQLLGILAQGSPGAGQLLERQLSSDTLARMGARAVPSTLISALTKLLGGSPASALRQNIWTALRNLLKQLEAEGPAMLTSPSKVFSDVRSAPAPATAGVLLTGRALHEALFRDAGSEEAPVALCALRYLEELVSAQGSSATDSAAAASFRAAVASRNPAWRTALLDGLSCDSVERLSVVCHIWGKLISGQKAVDSESAWWLSEGALQSLDGLLEGDKGVGNKAVLEQCVRALAGLVCHPALAQAAAAEGIELWAEEKLQAAARAVIEKLFLSHDKRSIGAPAALKMMGAIAKASAGGKEAMQPLCSLLSNREAVWRDLRCLDEASRLTALLQSS